MKPEGAAYLIARLNAKGSSWSMRVDGMMGGITPSDIAAALSYGKPKLSAIDMSIGLLAFAGHESEREAVWGWLCAVTMRLADKWGKRNPERNEALAGLVMDEVVPKHVCPTCKRRGEAPTPNGIIAKCIECGGYGWVIKQDKDKADIIGVNKSGYSRVWKQREGEIKYIYQQHEQNPIEKLERNL